MPKQLDGRLTRQCSPPRLIIMYQYSAALQALQSHLYQYTITNMDITYKLGLFQNMGTRKQDSSFIYLVPIDMETMVH